MESSQKSDSSRSSTTKFRVSPYLENTVFDPASVESWAAQRPLHFPRWPGSRKPRQLTELLSSVRSTPLDTVCNISLGTGSGPFGASSNSQAIAHVFADPDSPPVPETLSPKLCVPCSVAIG